MSRSIIYITDSLTALDDSQQLNLLAAEMARCGHWEVHVALIGSGNAPMKPLAGADVKIHCLPQGISSGGRIADVSAMLTAANGLKRLLDSVGPDVVHTWGQKAQRHLGATRMLIRRGNPKSKWLSTIVRKPEKSGFLASAWDRRFCKQIEKVFVPHVSLKASVLGIGFAQEQVVVSNAAVAPPAVGANDDTGGTMREKLLARIGLAGKPTIVAGTVADLVPATRMKDLIWATDLLNCIRDDFHLVIFGEGHQRQNLERFASFTLAQSHVHFLPPEEAEELLGGLDVYWHSHLLHPLPSPLLCAMANKIPVISVYGEGTEEIILHQQTAMAVNYGARDEFARWTKFLIEKPSAARQLAEQGKDHVLENFPLEQMVAGYRTELEFEFELNDAS